MTIKAYLANKNVKKLEVSQETIKQTFEPLIKQQEFDYVLVNDVFLSKEAFFSSWDQVYFYPNDQFVFLREVDLGQESLLKKIKSCSSDVAMLVREWQGSFS